MELELCARGNSERSWPLPRWTMGASLFEICKVAQSNKVGELHEIVVVISRPLSISAISHVGGTGWLLYLFRQQKVARVLLTLIQVLGVGENK